MQTQFLMLQSQQDQIKHEVKLKIQQAWRKQKDYQELETSKIGQILQICYKDDDNKVYKLISHRRLKRL
ncbi:unnamed protein product [Paramecium sonneborni]|uniref:Uncharacterized protein n=1 Tax=Paramecium sonneborni TaxID=65129 RepID=A0A8S1Q7V6_9CILI|nr:unnamed protein product [Paramecium sonneborni]